MKVSRRRYQTVLRMLNQAVADTKLPWPQRFRACELIHAIQTGTLLPGWTSPRRDRKTVKELLEERALEKRLKDELRDAGSQSPSEAQDEQEEPSLDELTTNNPEFAKALAHYYAVKTEGQK
jgi:hypothetical protein